MDKIVTINDLREVIENDSSNHEFKVLAKLFCSAMDDWPTLNQIKIKDFINELYDYYGFPLTIEKIKNKKFNLNNDDDVWRQESASSIIEIINVSTKSENESDFEKILTIILNYK